MRSTFRTVLFASLAVFAQTAAAAGVARAMPLSTTPSSTEPYLGCPAAAPGHVECPEIVEPAAYDRAKYALGEVSSQEEGSGELGGWSPENLKSAYKLPATGGKNETVAVVLWYNYATAEADLKVYRERYKLYFNGTETACTRANGCFQKINQKGESSTEEAASVYPKAGTEEKEKSAAKEMSLDLDMVSAVCPECKLLLVEANNTGNEAVYTAEDEAAAFKEGTKFPGTTVVSNSWDGFEESTELEDDMYVDHPGIPVVFSAGDYGYVMRYPAASHYVISVGGTRLKKEASGSREWTEEVWYKKESEDEGTSSGCSKYEPQPLWQTLRVYSAKKACAKRIDNDVSAVAENVSAYDSGLPEKERWDTRGGTSASAPIIAGVEALSTSYARDLGADAFYLPTAESSLYDITKGFTGNGECTSPEEDKFLCYAEVGYDGPTGWGSPDGPLTMTSAAPLALTRAATGVTSVQAVLNGSVDPQGEETTYHFEYGKTTAYGTSVPVPSASIGSGALGLEESKTITGLEARTVYDFRVVASNATGTTYGENQTLTTLPEGPFYKVAGARLASGESKEVKDTVTSSTRLYNGVRGYMKCTTQAFAAGAKLLGSTGANPGTGEVTLELSGCTEEEAKRAGCKVEPIKSYPLTAKLVYLNKERKGALAIEFTPVKGQKFALITVKGTGCNEEVYVTGDLVAGLYSGGKPVEVGKEPAEAKALELKLTVEQPAVVWVEKSGELVETSAEPLSYLTGFIYFVEGAHATLELAGSSTWGAFT